MAHIETGVDRLVHLIEDKEKITIAKAAKELGVSEVVITEWADFLHDEKLITIEYKLRSTILKKRAATKGDQKFHQKDLENKKGNFIRKVDTSLRQLERQSDGISHLKEEFEKLKKRLGGELEQVRAELAELQKYEELKKNIDTDISRELEAYKSQVKQASSALKIEQQRFEDLIGEIEQEESHLTEEREYVVKLEDLQEEFEDRSKELQEFMRDARKQVLQSKDDIKASEKHLDGMKKKMHDLVEETKKIKNDKIGSLEERRKEHEQTIDDLQNKIVEKAQQAKLSVTKDVKEAEKVAKDFETFFSRKFDADKEIKLLDKQRAELSHELELIKRKATALRISASHDGIEELSELTDKYGELEERHKEYANNIENVMNKVIK